MTSKHPIGFDERIDGVLSLEKNLHLLQDLSTAVICCNAKFHIEFTNPAAQALLDISEIQALGENVLSFLINPNMEDILLRCLATTQNATLRQVEVLSASRRTKLVDCILTPVQSQESGFLALEMNEVNQVARQLEENTMEVGQHVNTQVIRAIAHEIKNPLGGLRGAAQLLNRELGRNPDMRPYTEIIIRETDRLCGLVDSMSQSQAPINIEPINIHEVLEHVYHLALAEVADSFAIIRDYDPSLPLVDGDRELLIQAFVNMVQNAIEASGDSGTVRLRTRVQRQATIGKTRHLRAARIDIEDNGCGVPADIIDQVFYPMISGKSKGEGLGLSIVHQIITRHGGSISCKSRPGQTCFSTVLIFTGSNGGNK